MVQRINTALSSLLLVCATAIAAPLTDGAKGEANAKLRDTHWALSSIDGSAISLLVEPKAKPAFIVLNSSSQHLSGFTGCNQINGRFTQRGTQLAVKALGTTKRSCAKPAMAQEQKLVAALSAIDAYRIEGSRLSLMQNETVRVVFEAEKSHRR